MDENEEFFISGSEDGDIKVSVNGITWFEYNRVLMRQAHGNCTGITCFRSYSLLYRYL